MLSRVTRKLFSATLDARKQLIPTQYLVNAARVCVRMPTHGDTWFFIEPTTTVHAFKSQAKQEDTQIIAIDVMDSKGSVNDQKPMLQLLESSQMLLRLNNISYEFGTNLDNNLTLT